MYVLKRNEDGKFVALPGSKKSYTSNLRDARQFVTREEAECDRCGNERIVNTEELLQQRWGNHDRQNKDF